jgi:hypothetical protein
MIGAKKMDEKRVFDKHDSDVSGPQTNVGGNAQGLILSGEFHDKVIFNEQPATPKIIPLQKPLRVAHFIGREKELEDLLRDLQPGRAITICGPDGMGKTALASEVIWRLAPSNDSPEYFPDGIIYYTFYHQPKASIAMEAIARAYGEDPRPTPTDAARRVLAGRSALIVLDGTEAADDLELVLSIAGSCGVLITTSRHSDAPADFSDLPPLPLSQAVKLLQSWAGEMASDKAICQRICDLLGGLPLGVLLAGRYMAQRRQTSTEYLIWLEKTPLAALDLGAKQHQSIPLLMEHSLDQVSELSRTALGVSGVLAAEPFDSELIATALGIQLLEADKCLGELIDYGLLLHPDARYQITHSLVHLYARKQLNPESEALVRMGRYYCAFIDESRKRDSIVYDPEKKRCNGFAIAEMGTIFLGQASLDFHQAHISSLHSALRDVHEWGRRLVLHGQLRIISIRKSSPL